MNFNYQDIYVYQRMILGKGDGEINREVSYDRG